MSEYDIKVAELTKEKEALLLRMEKLADNFRAAAAEFLSSWFETQVKNEIKVKADLTTKLKKEQISLLKQKVKNLQSDSRRVVDEFLLDETIWWHKNHGNQGYEYYGNRPPNVIDRAMRLAAGKVAPMLEELGYLPTDHSDHFVWREYDPSGNYHPPTARPSYPYSLDWSPQMKEIMAEYDKACRRGNQIDTEVKQLQRQKLEKQVEDTWNSV